MHILLHKDIKGTNRDREKLIVIGTVEFFTPQNSFKFKGRIIIACYDKNKTSYETKFKWFPGTKRLSQKNLIWACSRGKFAPTDLKSVWGATFVAV